MYQSIQPKSITTELGGKMQSVCTWWAHPAAPESLNTVQLVTATFEHTRHVLPGRTRAQTFLVE